MHALELVIYVDLCRSITRFFLSLQCKDESARLICAFVCAALPALLGIGVSAWILLPNPTRSRWSLAATDAFAEHNRIGLPRRPSL